MIKLIFVISLFALDVAYAGTKENLNFCRETKTFLNSEIFLLSNCKNAQTKKIVDSLDSTKCEKYIINFLDALITISTTPPMSSEKCMLREVWTHTPQEYLVSTFTSKHRESIIGIIDGNDVSKKLLQLNLSEFDEKVLLKLAYSFKTGSAESRKVFTALFDKELTKYKQNFFKPKYNSSLLKKIASDLNLKIPTFKKVGYITFGDDCTGIGREDVYIDSSKFEKLNSSKICTKTLEIFSLLKDRRVSEDDISNLSENRARKFMTKADAEKIKQILNDPEIKKEVNSLTTEKDRKHFLEGLEKLMPELDSMQGQVQPWHLIDKLWLSCSGEIEFIHVGPPRESCL